MGNIERFYLSFDTFFATNISESHSKLCMGREGGVTVFLSNLESEDTGFI